MSIFSESRIWEQVIITALNAKLGLILSSLILILCRLSKFCLLCFPLMFEFCSLQCKIFSSPKVLRMTILVSEIRKRMVNLHCRTRLLSFAAELREFTFQVFICKHLLLFHFHLLRIFYTCFNFLKASSLYFHPLQSCLQVRVLRNGEAGTQ